MIYYFSGTGNSKWVAEQLAVLTGDKAESVIRAVKDGPTAICTTGDIPFGIVFPVYAWGPPTIVLKFLSSVRAYDPVFTYAVCTCGDNAGNTMEKLRRKFSFKSAYSVVLPNNYIPMFEPDSPDLVRQKIDAARKRLPEIAADIIARRNVFDVRKGAFAALKTTVVNPLFNRFAMSPSRFFVETTCNGCGLCERNCPMGTIKLINNRPVWRGTCQQCMSCINRCPQQAIQYGKTTRKRRRYVFPVEIG